MALTWTTARIRRREDQVWLDFALGNLTVDSTGPGGPVLVRTSPGSAYLVVTLGAQHVAEQVFDEGEARTRPVGTRVAGASRLVFRVPDEVTSLPYTDEALLGWGELALQVAPGAVPRGQMPSAGAAAPAAPDETQTALEIPWRLLLSPAADAAWAHASAPVTHGGRTELWHTRMVATTGGVADEDASAPTLRVLWATDDAFPTWLAGAPAPTVPPAAGLPFRLPLTPRDRVELVRATSDHTIPGYVPDPVDVERLLLSGLGATMSVRGAWNPPPAVLSLIGWTHRVGTGRDQAVRLVQRGHLLPFGHPAALVRVVERVVAAAPDGTATAYLRSRRLLVLGDRTRTYPAYGQRSGGRGLPFTSVTVLDAQSPFLDDPLPLVGALGTRAFVPRVGGAAHAFAFLAVDAAGRQVSFTAPVLFADSVVAYAEADMALVRAAYNGLPAQDPIRRRPTGAQMVAWAPPADAGDTEVETHAMTFAAEQPAGVLGDTAAFADRGQPLCHPVVVSALVRLPKVDAVTGSPTGPVEAHPDERYVQTGFGGANRGEVFLALETPIDLGLPPDRGSLMDPGLRVVAVSRRLGPVGGDLGTLAAGVIDVPAMLAAAPSQPKFFGGISLSSIVRAVTIPPAGQEVVGAVLLRPPTPSALPRALPPGLRAQAAAPAAAGPFPDERPGEEPPFGAQLVFEPQLQSDPLGILTFAPHAYGRVAITWAQGDPRAARRDDGVAVEVLILSAPPWSLSAQLPVPDAGPYVGHDKAFTLTLFGKSATFIAIDFEKLSFRSLPGRDIELDTVIAGVRFDGVLRFVQRIMDAFSGGDDSPFVFSATTEYLEAGVSISLPDIPLGVLALKNIRFAWTFQVPFFFVPGNRRALVFAFAFASRENPFQVMVYCFGGGGYLRIGIQVRGIQFLEIALEFGFVRQFPGGPVASGSIEAMVGIHFQLERQTDGSTTVTLTAYVRARGELTLVGIVSIILELYLGLSYVAVLGSPGKVVGQARVTLRVKVFFVSIEASATVEHRFSGGTDGDPTFLDQMPTQAVWDEYVTAFAPVGA